MTHNLKVQLRNGLGLQGLIQGRIRKGGGYEMGGYIAAQLHLVLYTIGDGVPLLATHPPVWSMLYHCLVATNSHTPLEISGSDPGLLTDRYIYTGQSSVCIN